MPFDIMCIHCCLYTFIIADSARGRGQNVQRCRCRVSGFRNKCVNNRACSPRTCWHPRCHAPKLSRNCNMSPWLAVLAQPTAPASTYEERIPSRQPPELETPPLAARAERLQKHHDTQGHARRRQHGPAAARSHRGELPRALTPAHGPAAARTHPRTHHRRWIGWLGRILSLVSCSTV